MNLFRRPKKEAEPEPNFSWQVIPPPAGTRPARVETAPVQAPVDSPPTPSGEDRDRLEQGERPTPARRRRRPARPREASDQTEPRAAGPQDSANAPLEQPPDEEKKPAAPRSRRGRGGRGGATATATAQGEQRQPAPDISALSPDNRVLAELLMRQTAALEDLAGRQAAALEGVSSSLQALAGRLDTGAGVGSRMPRVGVFVDVPNIIYTADRLRARIDFGKLLDILSAGREMVRASAYAPISDDPTQALETQRFVQPFVDRGYKIVTKPLKRFADGSIKANFDVELAMDVLIMADRLDVVCLVSGDGDFRRLVELVESKGVRVEVVAFAQSTAAELRTSADEFIEMGSILPRIT
ncbi:MAG: NYN domain-containing protein [Dehalococcoidia bacterium]